MKNNRSDIQQNSFSVKSFLFVYILE